MPVDRIQRIAIHEAGHATAARLLRLPNCGEASVAPRSYARVPTDHGASSICAIMAGSAAEIVTFGDYDPEGNEVDRELAWEQLERCGYEDADALWNYTLALVRRHQARIGYLAVKLKRAGTLDGPAIDRIVARG